MNGVDLGNKAGAEMLTCVAGHAVNVLHYILYEVD